jgi:Flp pilus assembly protein TadD
MRARSLIAATGIAIILAVGTGTAVLAIESEPIDVLAAENPDFVEGRRAVAARDWNAAIQSLTAADKRSPGSADIHNLLGFAYRNSGQVDLALTHYRRALQIDPSHRGAHEYIGEAYLMVNDLAKAEQHLAILKRLCERVCEERDDLGRKIAAYRGRNK